MNRSRLNTAQAWERRASAGLLGPHGGRSWLAVGLLALAGCGGGGGDATVPELPGNSALSVSRSGELLAYTQRKLRQAASGGGSLNLGPLADTAAPPSAVTVPAGSALPERSTTLVQEAGVDEADLLKSDGTHFYALDARPSATPQLLVQRRGSDGLLTHMGQLPLNLQGADNLNLRGLVLQADAGALAVVGQQWVPMGKDPLCGQVCPADALPGLGGSLTIAPSYQWMASRVSVQRFDVSNPAATQPGVHLAIDGNLVDTRQVGEHLVVVTTHRPVLAPQLLPSDATAAQREAAIAAVTTAELLPQLRINGGAAVPLLADTDCWVQGDNASATVALTVVTTINLRSADLARQSRCFVGGSDALYMSPTSLYLASSRYPYIPTAGGLVRYDGEMRTDIHKLSFVAGTVTYKGSGSVPGHLGWNSLYKSYRLSEQDGLLRVLSFTGTTGWFSLADAGNVPASPAVLSILRDAGSGTLATVSTLPNTRRPAAIGKPNEQVHAVRFVGNRGYVVTFRQIDPLYVLDLSDPADPRVAGELELPGFSDQLVPLANGLMLGVGRDVSVAGRQGGVKLALFDVADASAPKVLNTLVLGAAGSATTLDSSPHGLNLLVKGNQVRAALPVWLSSSDYNGYSSGLQRLEIDTSQRSLVARPLLGANNLVEDANLWLQRSLQIGDQIYWLRAGSLSVHDW